MIEYLYRLFIPRQMLNDITNLTYVKNLVAACAIAAFTIPFYAVIYYWLGYTPGAIGMLIGLVFMWSSLIALNVFNSFNAAKLIFITAVLTLLFWLVFQTGGIDSTAAYWLILPPLLAAFIGGIRLSVLCCTVCVFYLTLLYLLVESGYIFPLHPLRDPLVLQVMGIEGLCFVIVALAFFYETAKASSLARLEYLAYHDSLTGLMNRDAFERALREKIDSIKHSNASFSVLHIRIDNLKKIYEIFGNDIGDLLLMGIVDRLQRYLPTVKPMARISGSGVIKLIADRTMEEKHDKTKELANIITFVLKAPFKLREHEILVTSSIGVAYYQGDGILVDHHAGLALSRAKKLGGNRVQYFTDEIAHEEKRLLYIENNLRHAIKNNEFSLCYQPQFSLKEKNKISGIEVLLRWRQTTLGSVASDIFIPIAERVGMIPSIGEWVMKESCQQFMVWRSQNLLSEAMTLAVNISVHQIYNENFVAMVQRILQETGIPPANLELELTETAVISDATYVVDIMKKLANIGIKVLLDDFGVGYTSLKFLVALPVSGIKIDKAFIDNLPNDRNKAMLIASLINFAHKIHIKVIAEGVEHESQLRYLNSINCDDVQGYLLSKPLDTVAMTELFKQTS